MDQMKQQFLFAGGLKSKNMTERVIKDHVKKQDKKNKAGLTVMSARVPMEYDMIKDKKVLNYTDHKG